MFHGSSPEKKRNGHSSGCLMNLTESTSRQAVAATSHVVYTPWTTLHTNLETAGSHIVMKHGASVTTWRALILCVCKYSL